MKAITHLVLHNTETPEGVPITPEDIITLHTSKKSIRDKITKGVSTPLGFGRPGFDVLIGLDGKLHTLINENNPSSVDVWGISAGKQGINGMFRNIAYVGGKTISNKSRKDTRTPEQSKTLATIVNYYVARFPNIIVVGIGDLPNSDDVFNPTFDVNGWLTSIGISEKNHYKK